MSDNSSLADSFAQLDNRIRKLAEEDGDVYLPNVLPTAHADYIFICMEPSLGPWAGKGRQKADKMLNDGFRNFLWSVDDFVFHYSIQRFLLQPGQTYYVTDVSKGAMTVQSANMDRAKRYEKWYPLLLEELGVLASPNAIFFSVGRAVTECLQQLDFSRPLHQVLHFSSQAAAFRKRSVAGRENEFEKFKEAVSADDIYKTAKDRLAESGMAATLQETILTRLTRSGTLSDSRKMLAFTYKTQFERVVHRGSSAKR